MRFNLIAILTDLDKKYKHDETDESGEKEKKPTKKRKLLETLASNTKSILNSIKVTLQSNEKLTAKLTAKQQAAAAAVQQKAAAAQHIKARSGAGSSTQSLPWFGGPCWHLYGGAGPPPPYDLRHWLQ